MLTALISIHEYPSIPGRTPAITSQVVTFENKAEFQDAQAALQRTYPSSNDFTVHTTILKGE